MICYSKVYSTLLYSTLLCSALLYSTLLYSTLLYSTLLYSTPRRLLPRTTWRRAFRDVRSHHVVQAHRGLGVQRLRAGTNIYIYIYKHATMSGSQYSLSYYNSSFLLFAARGAHSARGFIRWVILAWTLGDIKWQNARAARDPISGPFHPPITGKEKAQRGSRARVSCNLWTNNRNPLRYLGASSSFASSTIIRQARRSCSSQGANPLTPRYAIMRRHPNRQP